jgi:hypothetical protein
MLFKIDRLTYINPEYISMLSQDWGEKGAYTNVYLIWGEVLMVDYDVDTFMQKLIKGEIQE